MAKTNKRKAPAKAAPSPRLVVYHPEETLSHKRLPYVGETSWDVPTAGGYAGGNITGAALADAYMKWAREDGRGAHDLHQLQNIVLAMAEQLEDNKFNTSLVGQVVGFFGRIDDALTRLVKAHGNWLDTVTVEHIMARANIGLRVDEDEATELIQTRVMMREASVNER